MRKRKNKAKINIPMVMLLILLVFIFGITKSWVFTLIVLIGIMLFAAYLKSPAGKGKVGELVVRLMIGRDKPKKAKYSVHNLTFHDGEKSVQIDHIVINKKGVHVIETKNYSGRIYGSEYDRQWTQVLAYGRVKHKLHSPLHQNYGHIMGLKTVLNLNEDVFRSYIVFTARAQIMNEYQTPVIYPIAINKSIKANKEILSEKEVIRIHRTLLSLKKSNTISNKEHVRSIKERMAER